MSYIDQLVDSNTRSISEMLKNSITEGLVTSDEIRNSLLAEAAPVLAGGDIYNLTATTNALIHKLINSPDRDMLIIVKKILRSTKYAATTWYSVAGIDGNPHHLPITKAAVVG
ncbi:MAG: hypothetical protein NTV34_18185 [Proteobacteria bacterium]|nr:hypothetical protein [Pseudomonadota bacterium]